MANAQPQPPAATPDPVKRRAVRRLIAALALIAIAVVGLAVMDRMARKKTEAPPPPKAPVAQAPVATPTPALPPTEPAAPADEAAPPADASATPGDALAPLVEMCFQIIPHARVPRQMDVLGDTIESFRFRVGIEKGRDLIGHAYEIGSFHSQWHSSSWTGITVMTAVMD